VWAGWSVCDVTCGSGSRSRTRTCDHPPPAYGGDDCVGPDRSTDVCVHNACPGRPYPLSEHVYQKPLSHQTAMPQRLYSVLKTCKRAVGSPRNTPKSPVTPEWRPYSVPIAFYKVANRRGARCVRAVQSPRTPCDGCKKRRGLAFAQGVGQRSVGTMWQRCGVF